VRKIVSVIIFLSVTGILSAQNPANPARPSKIFTNPSDEIKFFKWQAAEKNGFGRAGHIKRYNSTPMKQTVLMQRSGRKRLYDHNILLRAFFEGKIIHSEYGDMIRYFKHAAFINIGSAILYEEGAPTVRDIYEDPIILKNLS